MKNSTRQEALITNIEKETALCLLKDLSVKQLQSIEFLSFDGVQSRTKRIREKMHATTIYGALGRMIALGIVTREELINCLPSDLQTYVK